MTLFFPSLTHLQYPCDNSSDGLYFPDSYLQIPVHLATICLKFWREQLDPLRISVNGIPPHPSTRSLIPALCCSWGPLVSQEQHFGGHLGVLYEGELSKVRSSRRNLHLAEIFWRFHTILGNAAMLTVPIQKLKFCQPVVWQ